jgi:hypothetical protein
MTLVASYRMRNIFNGVDFAMFIVGDLHEQ